MSGRTPSPSILARFSTEELRAEVARRLCIERGAPAEVPWKCPECGDTVLNPAVFGQCVGCPGCCFVEGCEHTEAWLYQPEDD